MTRKKILSELHLAIRVGSLYDVFKNQNVVEEHNSIARTQGSVLFGKAGRRMANEKLDLLKNAINTSQNAFMILVRKSNRGFEAFAAPLYGIHAEGYAPNLKLVPSYYHHLAPDITLWLEIGQLTKMSTTRLSRFRLISNERSLVETLSICRTSVMFVKEVSNDS